MACRGCYDTPMTEPSNGERAVGGGGAGARRLLMTLSRSCVSCDTSRPPVATPQCGGRPIGRRHASGVRACARVRVCMCRFGLSYSAADRQKVSCPPTTCDIFILRLWLLPLFLLHPFFLVHTESGYNPTLLLRYRSAPPTPPPTHKQPPPAQFHSLLTAPRIDSIHPFSLPPACCQPGVITHAAHTTHTYTRKHTNESLCSGDV